MMNINNNQQPSQKHQSQDESGLQQPIGITPARQQLRIGEAKQHSQASSGNGRTHRAILSQGHDVVQMQYANALDVGGGIRRGWEGSTDNEDGPLHPVGQAQSDLSRTNQSGIGIAGQSLHQASGRKGPALLNSSRPNNSQHSSSFLDSKNAVGGSQQQPEFLAQGAGRPVHGVARPTTNQNWAHGPNDSVPSQRSVVPGHSADNQKSLSSQTQREANMQSRGGEKADETSLQHQASGNPSLAVGSLHQQNAQLIRSLGRGSHVLGVGSVNSNSTATMTVATALSVHNSSDRHASLPIQKQTGPPGAAGGALSVLPSNLPGAQPHAQPPLKQAYQHILHPPPSHQHHRDLQHSETATPLKIGHIPQSSGRMKEASAAGSSVIGSEALSRISAQGSKTTNGMKESRSPQMVLSTLLHGQGSEHQNQAFNDGQIVQGSNALPNLGVATNQNHGLQHKTPQIQLPSLLQNGAAANISQGQANLTVSKVKSFQRTGASYTYSHMKSPSASQADRDPYAERRNIQTGSLFQIRNKTTHSSINSGRKQIFSKSYATREQIGHASGSAGFANMTRSIEIHEVANSVERDRRESAESVEGNFFPEAIDGEIKGRYEQNSRERRLRSLGGKPLSSDNYEITTQSQNERINRLMQKKTSLPLENNVNHNNVLSTANSEQLPTLSPNRQTTNNAQVAGSAHLNNILSTLKKPAIVNGIITEHDHASKSVSPNYPLKQALQQQHKVIPIYGSNGLSQTPLSHGPQSNGTAGQGATMLGQPHHQGQQPQTFKPNAIKLTQARPPQAPGTVQHLSIPSAQQIPGTTTLLQAQQQQQPQSSETSKTQKAGQPARPEESASQPKTFDFHFVKILLRQSSSHSQKKGTSAGKTEGQTEPKQETFKEILLEREWLKKNSEAIPHFSEVISKVKETEGVEITMNCNSDAFYWLIDIVKIQTNYAFEFKKIDENGEPYEEMSPKEIEFRVQTKFFDITPENCLNKLVTSHFLQIKGIYEHIWQQFFLENFPAVINSCKISLSNLNAEIVAHIADRVSDAQLEKLKDRRDKFLSNLYRARIEQKLLRPCSSKRAHQITDHSIFYCEDCQKIMTLKHSRRISCKLEGNEARAFVDANGNLFVAHKFSDLNLQTDNYRVNQSQQPSSQQTAPPSGQQTPIDMAQFIRFFRERYRLCWKEIYLKFASISKNHEPEFCSQCSKWFRFCDLAGCEVKPESSGTSTVTSRLNFHQIDHRTSLNCLTAEDVLNYKRQIQVVNDVYVQKDVEALMKAMKEREKMKFVEPQSMNFEKKLSEAYLDFKASMDRKAKQRADKDAKPTKPALDLPVVEDEFEDLLFQGSQAQANIMWQLKGEPEMLKKFQKDAKAYVRDHPQGQNQQVMYDKVGACELDGYSGGYDKVESAQGKRKLSPRSMMRVNKLVRKRVTELKREQVFADDAKSMQLLTQTLRMQRGGDGGTDGSKKDKAKKTDWTQLMSGILEEKQNNEVPGRARDQLADIKIVKTAQYALQNVLGAQMKKPNKVLSDISQITQQQKKRSKKNNQNSSSGLCQQPAEQSKGNKPPTNPGYSSSKGDKDNIQSSAKDKEQSSRASAPQASSRDPQGAAGASGGTGTAQQQNREHQGGDTIPHAQTTQSSQRHMHVAGSGSIRGDHHQHHPTHGHGHPMHQGNYHLHVWDARDKFKNLPQHPQHNIPSYQQNMRSNSHNPSQMKVTSQNHTTTTSAAAAAAANVARSNSICSNERGTIHIGNAIQPQQFQFQQLKQKKDSSHNVHNHNHNVNNTNYSRQKTSQASHKNIRGGNHHNPSSFNVVDQ